MVKSDVAALQLINESDLAVQGVYVWKATGRYADGKYFDEVGDVTFLH